MSSQRESITSGGVGLQGFDFYLGKDSDKKRADTGVNLNGSSSTHLGTTTVNKIHLTLDDDTFNRRYTLDPPSNSMSTYGRTDAGFTPQLAPTTDANQLIRLHSDTLASNIHGSTLLSQDRLNDAASQQTQVYRVGNNNGPSSSQATEMYVLDDKNALSTKLSHTPFSNSFKEVNAGDLGGQSATWRPLASQGSNLSASSYKTGVMSGIYQTMEEKRKADPNYYRETTQKQMLGTNANTYTPLHLSNQTSNLASGTTMNQAAGQATTQTEVEQLGSSQDEDMQLIYVPKHFVSTSANTNGYVPKSEYDALVKRVETMQQKMDEMQATITRLSETKNSASASSGQVSASVDKVSGGQTGQISSLTNQKSVTGSDKTVAQKEDAAISNEELQKMDTTATQNAKVAPSVGVNKAETTGTSKQMETTTKQATNNATNQAANAQIAVTAQNQPKIPEKPSNKPQNPVATDKKPTAPPQPSNQPAKNQAAIQKVKPTTDPKPQAAQNPPAGTDTAPKASAAQAPAISRSKSTTAIKPATKTDAKTSQVPAKQAGEEEAKDKAATGAQGAKPRTKSLPKAIVDTKPLDQSKTKIDQKTNLAADKQAGKVEPKKQDPKAATSASAPKASPGAKAPAITKSASSVKTDSKTNVQSAKQPEKQANTQAQPTTKATQNQAAIQKSKSVADAKPTVEKSTVAPVDQSKSGSQTGAKADQKPDPKQQAAIIKKSTTTNKQTNPSTQSNNQPPKDQATIQKSKSVADVKAQAPQNPTGSVGTAPKAAAQSPAIVKTKSTTDIKPTTKPEQKNTQAAATTTVKQEIKKSDPKASTQLQASQDSGGAKAPAISKSTSPSKTEQQPSQPVKPANQPAKEQPAIKKSKSTTDVKAPAPQPSSGGAAAAPKTSAQSPAITKTKSTTDIKSSTNSGQKTSQSPAKQTGKEEVKKQDSKAAPNVQAPKQSTGANAPAITKSGSSVKSDQKQNTQSTANVAKQTNQPVKPNNLPAKDPVQVDVQKSKTSNDKAQASQNLAGSTGSQTSKTNAQGPAITRQKSITSSKSDSKTELKPNEPAGKQKESVAAKPSPQKQDTKANATTEQSKAAADKASVNKTEIKKTESVSQKSAAIQKTATKANNSETGQKPQVVTKVEPKTNRTASSFTKEPTDPQKPSFAPSGGQNQTTQNTHLKKEIVREESSSSQSNTPTTNQTKVVNQKVATSAGGTNQENVGFTIHNAGGQAASQDGLHTSPRQGLADPSQKQTSNGGLSVEVWSPQQHEEAKRGRPPALIHTTIELGHQSAATSAQKGLYEKYNYHGRGGPEVDHLINLLEHPVGAADSERVVSEGQVKFLNRSGAGQRLHDLYLVLTEHYLRLYASKAAYASKQLAKFIVPTKAIDATTSAFSKSTLGLDSNLQTQPYLSALFAVKLKTEFLPLYCNEAWDPGAGLTKGQIEDRLRGGPLATSDAAQSTKYLNYYKNVASQLYPALVRYEDLRGADKLQRDVKEMMTTMAQEPPVRSYIQNKHIILGAVDATFRDALRAALDSLRFGNISAYTAARKTVFNPSTFNLSLDLDYTTPAKGLPRPDTSSKPAPLSNILSQGVGSRTGAGGVYEPRFAKQDWGL